MPELRFFVDGAGLERYAAVPTLGFRLRIECTEASVPIRSVMLQCQIRIEVTRRHYDATEQSRLIELFGEPDHWSRSLQGLLWTHASALVPPFDGQCGVVLPVPCSFDFNLAATKYFSGVETGDIPLLVLFSGAIFYDDGDGLQISQIPWNAEARYRLPVAVWRELMAHFYPESAWLRLPRDTFDRFRRYKQRHGLPTLERALEQLLDERAQEAA